MLTTANSFLFLSDVFLVDRRLLK